MPRLFNIEGKSCISCDNTCETGKDGPSNLTSRLPALGIKIDDRGVIRGDGTDSFVTICLAGEKKPYHQDNPARPDLKQSNGAPRVCLNHLPPTDVVIDIATQQRFSRTTPPDRA